MSAQHRLRRCPTCGQKVGGVREFRVRARDFRWLTEFLPGTIGACDGDAIIEQHSTGRILLIESKMEGEELSLGQRRMLEGIAAHGIDVWCFWQTEDGESFRLATLTTHGELRDWATLTRQQVQEAVLAWWLQGTLPHAA